MSQEVGQFLFKYHLPLDVTSGLAVSCLKPTFLTAYVTQGRCEALEGPRGPPQRYYNVPMYICVHTFHGYKI